MRAVKRPRISYIRQNLNTVFDDGRLTPSLSLQSSGGTHPTELFRRIQGELLRMVSTCSAHTSLRVSAKYISLAIRSIFLFSSFQLRTINPMQRAKMAMRKKTVGQTLMPSTADIGWPSSVSQLARIGHNS
jgi:hypothetical protein